MNITNDWLTIATLIAAGVGTQLVRASFLVLPPSWQAPNWFTRALKYVAVAVLPALMLPEILFRDALPGELFNLVRITAAAFAMLVAWKTRHIFLTLLAGMVALWGLRWLGL